VLRPVHQTQTALIPFFVARACSVHRLPCRLSCARRYCAGAPLPRRTFRSFLEIPRRERCARRTVSQMVVSPGKQGPFRAFF
jgi:hypothetical protein